MEQPQQRTRRTYKRYPPGVWNKHKETVRRLFLGQDKTHKEVVAMLSERYDLTIGERQLKRKTEEWGFFKNIRSREMNKMVRTRIRRRKELDRPTEFGRKHGDGEFHQVPTAKLALHERRMESDPGSPSSTCSSLPSNIECYTPSDAAESPPGSEMETTPTTPTTVIQIPKPSLPSAKEVQVAAQFALDAKYHEAASHFRQLSRLTRSPWGSVLYDFNAEIMDIASHGGCPQTIAVRTSSALSRYLFREREKHRTISLFSITAARDTNVLNKVSSGLRTNAKFWGSVVVQQRVLQIWQPILGPDHPKMTAARDDLALKRSATIVNLDAHPHSVASQGTLEDFPELDETLEALFSLGDGPPDQPRSRIEAMERSRVGLPTHNKAMMRFGRSRALLALLYSLTEQYAGAQSAFHDSAETLCYETCVEVKLHRMLWDAEHRTRIWDWDGAWKLLGESRRVFDGAERSSPFFAWHFTERFAVLESAVQQRMSVDRVSELGDVDNLRGQVDGFHLSGFGDGQDARLESQKQWVKSTITSGAGVDIGAWRDFVHLSNSNS
ncbi:hypothetical protein QBC37DRAFT_380797 [Rhypophila decipiens]|uniref:Clr5 domain-containing protein n=1 Tax=Rhypophila decipiens TaxID=261697 RepID=A0AAN6XTQ2_9PEZI|nr:hypothetical protein QBC37DRAFT_380797 [Rhypophila decipiens]